MNNARPYRIERQIGEAVEDAQYALQYLTHHAELLESALGVLGMNRECEIMESVRRMRKDLRNIEIAVRAVKYDSRTEQQRRW